MPKIRVSILNHLKNLVHDQQSEIGGVIQKHRHPKIYTMLVHIGIDIVPKKFKDFKKALQKLVKEEQSTLVRESNSQSVLDNPITPSRGNPGGQ